MSELAAAGTIRRIMPLPSAEEIASAVEALADHDHGEVIAEVVARVLLEEVDEEDGGVEPGLVERLSEETELDEEARSFDSMDPFEVLEQGPSSTVSAALLGALLAKGIAKRIDGADGVKAQRALIAEMLDRLDWLEATTAIAPYLAIASTLSRSTNELFWTSVVRMLAETSRKEPPDAPKAAARQRTCLMIRASALAHAPQSVKKAVAGDVLAELQGSEVKRIALAAIAGVDDAEAASRKETAGERGALGARAASVARAPRLVGDIEGKPWGLTARLLAAVTGVLLIRWLYRLAARYIMGLRREGTMAMRVNEITLELKVHLLGRAIRESTSTYSLRSLRVAEIERRFRYLHLLVGALALVVLVALGVNFLVEGACSGYPPLALFGLVVVGGGILLDVLLEALVPGKKGVCTITLDFGRKRLVRLRGVDRVAAEAFVKALSGLIPAPKKSARG